MKTFAVPVGLAIICENHIGSYCWDMQLASKTCNINIFAGPWASTAFKVFADTIYEDCTVFKEWQNESGAHMLDGLKVTSAKKLTVLLTGSS